MAKTFVSRQTDADPRPTGSRRNSAGSATRARSATGPPEAASSAVGASEEEIRTRAYLRFLERGGADGQAEDDWYAAEQDLRTRKP